MSDTVEPLLEVRGVTLRFGGVTAIEDVSFDVRRGELFAVIGPNGAGKTSIFNCLNGVYRPQEGSIRVKGPKATPMRTSFRPCPTASFSTSRFCAPSAIRIPISRVRWATE